MGKCGSTWGWGGGGLDYIKYWGVLYGHLVQLYAGTGQLHFGFIVRSIQKPERVNCYRYTVLRKHFSRVWRVFLFFM